MRYKQLGYMALLVLFGVFIINYSLAAYNYNYMNVTTRVNVTNAFPVIDTIKIDQNILLNAGSTKIVNCNVSLHDWNGYADIANLNATFWDNNTVNASSPDDNATHYTNLSCINISQNGYYANYTCSFAVYYYANNGSNWLCGATVIDSYNLTNYQTNTTTIQAYYALNVTPLIDYGNMLLGTYSPNITANVSNIGNALINLSVRGYGGFNPATGSGYAMFCQFGNITIANERFSINSSDDWATKTVLSSNLQNITGFSIPKTNGTLLPNATYWQIYTDPTNAPFGICNGTVEFNAIGG